MINLIAIFSLIVLVTAAAFHFYWSLGGKLGISVAVPHKAHSKVPIFKLPAFGSFIVGALLLMPTLLILILTLRIQTPIDIGFIKISSYSLATIFLLRALSFHTYLGWFKKVNDTRFAWYDTYIYSPACILIAISLFCLAYFYG